MKIYMVGGAVRDSLLNENVSEKDWVVVGSSPREMESLGFMPVGEAFPVFLHPTTKEEYALARCEKKISFGYKGFKFHTSPSVTIEQDLKRRDLTINAIAMDSKGKIIDPYNGKHDIHKKILRHVSPAFAEDPVRILRIARFASKLPAFKIHKDTLKFMKQMVAKNEINYLTPERVWKELYKTLACKAPYKFFKVLERCNALQTLFPEIEMASKGMKLFKKDISHLSLEEKFSILLHDLPCEKIIQICNKWIIPNKFKKLAYTVALTHQDYANLKVKNPSDILQFLQKTDAQRQQERFNKLLNVFLHCTTKKKIDHKKNVFLKNIIIELKNINYNKIKEHYNSSDEFLSHVTTEKINIITNMLHPEKTAACIKPKQQ